MTHSPDPRNQLFSACSKPFGTFPWMKQSLLLFLSDASRLFVILQEEKHEKLQNVQRSVLFYFISDAKNEIFFKTKHFFLVAAVRKATRHLIEQIFFSTLWTFLWFKFLLRFSSLHHAFSNIFECCGIELSAEFISHFHFLLLQHWLKKTSNVQTITDSIHITYHATNTGSAITALPNWKLAEMV